MQFKETERQEIAEDILRCGSVYAARLGLAYEDRKDCAQDFTVILLSSRRYEEYRRSGRSPALLSYWAKNHAKDFRRKLLIDQNHVTPLEENWMLAATEQIVFDRVEANSLIQEEIRQELLAAIQLLSPLQQEILKRRFYNGESNTTIAETFKKTPKAVNMIFKRAFLHLRSILERRGFNEAEADRCLALLANPPPVKYLHPYRQRRRPWRRARMINTSLHSMVH